MPKLNIADIQVETVNGEMNFRELFVIKTSEGYVADRLDIERWLFSATIEDIQLLGMPELHWCKSYTDVVLAWNLAFGKFQLLEKDYSTESINGRAAIDIIDITLNALEDALENNLFLMTTAGYYSYPPNPTIELCTSRNSHERFINVRQGEKEVVVEVTDY